MWAVEHYLLGVPDKIIKEFGESWFPPVQLPRPCNVTWYAALPTNASYFISAEGIFLSL